MNIQYVDAGPTGVEGVAGVEGAGGTGGPGCGVRGGGEAWVCLVVTVQCAGACGARGRRQGLAGLRADAPSRRLAAWTASGRAAALGHGE